MLAVLISAVLTFSLGTVELCADNSREDVREVIRDGFYRFSESIDISAFSVLPEELSSIISSVIKDDPYLFFVNGQMSYSYRPGGHVISLSPTYCLVGEDAFNAWEICRMRVREMAAEAMKYSGEIARALFLHDEICRLYRYDEELKSDSIYGFFMTGKGTCQAYTQLYTAVLRECGIDSHYVASDTIEHIWNYVKIDGEWYHVDLTWDDSVSNESGVSRRHFLCSDEAAKARGHKDWYSVVSVNCVSEKFSEKQFDDVLHVKFFRGDTDHNGKVEFHDLLMVKGNVDLGRALSCIVCADVDGDGSVTEADAVLIRKKLLGID